MSRPEGVRALHRAPTPRPGPGTGAPVTAGRWVLLAAFAALIASTQVLWLSLAPVTTQVHELLDVSEGAIGDLAAVNPILYVLLAIPVGRWTDRRFTAAVTTGALLTAGGALIRTVDPSSYGWVLAGQVVLSVGQPLVLNATTKVAARYFPPGERTVAIAVASAAQFVGILVAATTAQTLLDLGGLRLLLAVHAAGTTVTAAAVVLAVRMPAAFAEVTAAPSGSVREWLQNDRLLRQLAVLLFVGVGIFNAIATWLDTVLTDLGSPGVGGTLIATTTVAGIAGATVLPAVAARFDRRRAIMVTTTVLAVVTFPIVAIVPDVRVVGAVLAVLGYFLLACLPIALDWSELEAGPARAATATGFLLLAGNLGGAVLVLVVQIFAANPYLALGVMSLIAVPGVLVANRLPDHARSHLEDDRSTVRGAAA